MAFQGIEIVGLLGGASIAVSLAPQLFKTWQTKCASDISYAYQAVYIVGCTLVNAYAITEGLWPVYVPCLIEECFIISLTIMKFVYDGQEQKQDKELQEKPQEKQSKMLKRGETRRVDTVLSDGMDTTSEKEASERLSV